jgi:hypothetical protein
MIARRSFAVLGAAAIAWCAMVATASGQLTTATVAGSIKDQQGAVIPGATAVLISQTKGTKTAPVVTSSSGDFVIPNVSADTYTLEVTMSGFKTLKRSNVEVHPGDRVALGQLAIEVGGITEEVMVKGESPVIQANSGERSFTITTDAVQNLPIANRSFTSLATFAPGVSGTNRIGGGGQNNILVDSVNLVDTGNNGTGLQLNVEAIGEVKVLTSGYQAEYGRSSGLQISAVTKSGTNRFHGSLYDVERNSSWNANSWVNKRNNTPLPVDKQRDWGYSIGGPAGKPGGNNKIFFFFSQEWRPRSGSGSINRFRVPTAEERAGNFSASRDNNGNIYNLIRDASTGLPCTASDNRGCFADGGVVGKIPAASLYQLGLNVLNLWPLPNSSEGYATTNSYNFVNTQAAVASHQMQDAIRLDYQASQTLRFSWKLVEQNATRLANQAGQAFSQGGNLINGYNDAIETQPHIYQTSATVNYSLNASTFLEATWGMFNNYIGTPTMTEKSNKNNVGLGAFPMLFPDAGIIDTQFYSFDRLTADAPPWFRDGRSFMLPNFSWGNRIANSPPNMRDYGCCLNTNQTHDLTISATKIMGRHTAKAGFYFQHSWKPQTAGVGAATPYNGSVNFQNDTNNPLDSTFGFANAALGIFSSYGQQSRFLEGGYKYNNIEFYLQDNWKVNARLTLDYGLRFVHQQPQYESYGLASNFVPEDWKLANAPQLYRPACAPGGVAGTASCQGQNLRAQNPVNGEILGAGSSALVGQLVPGIGTVTNGIYRAGEGPVPKTNYNWPTMGYAPRLGAAYDLSGDQRFVIRGGYGIFFNRPDGNTIFGQVNNPPASSAATVNNGTLQSLSGGLRLSAPSALNVFQLESPLPTSGQWNIGMQMLLPWASSVDVSYVGQHAWDQLQSVDINAPDFGTAYKTENQNPTLASNPTPAATALVTNFLRPYRGFGAINYTIPYGFNSFHSLQLSFSRRFKNGISFGLNDTVTLSQTTSIAPRLQHDANGNWSIRPDQDQATELLKDNRGARHIIKGNFVWDLPDVPKGNTAQDIIGYVLNDWQLSGVLTADTGSPYSLGFSYTGLGNVNLTGSPNYGARVVLVGDPGDGCSSDPTRQFNVTSVAGPAVNSVGLESSNNYLIGCANKLVDFAIARNVRLHGNRQIQLRVDIFNAFNTVIFTGRNTTINFPSLAQNAANQASNLVYDPNTGALLPGRDIPRTAGFGAVTNSNNGRSVQFQVRFQF